MSSIAYSSHRSVCKMTGQITESSSWREFGGRNSIDDEKQTWNGIRYAQWIFLPFRLVLFLCRVPCEIRMLMTETPCWQSCHGCVYVRWFIQSAHGCSDLWLPSILITVTLVNQVNFSSTSSEHVRLVKRMGCGLIQACIWPLVIAGHFLRHLLS